jgi:hypothetical protein
VRYLPEANHGFPSFIWSYNHLHALTTYPPARASSPKTPVYMVFQPIRCTAHAVANMAGELLPRLFTLDTPRHDGSFLLHYYTLSDIFPLGRMVLCVARTFLHALSVTMEQPAGSKGIKRKCIWMKFPADFYFRLLLRDFEIVTSVAPSTPYLLNGAS